MNKSDEKLNLPRDISVFEYVSGNQSDAAKAQFEKALEGNEELQAEVELEKQLSSLVKQTEQPSPVASNNINQLFDKIDADIAGNETPDMAESSARVIPFKKPAAGFAIAASLFLAVFLSVNLTNNDVNNTDQLLEPSFNVLTTPQDDIVDVNILANEQRLVKFMLAEPLSKSALTALMEKHQLQSLNQSLNESIIIAKTPTAVDEKKLSLLKSDAQIKEVELIKFN